MNRLAISPVTACRPMPNEPLCFRVKALLHWRLQIFEYWASRICIQILSRHGFHSTGRFDAYHLQPVSSVFDMDIMGPYYALLSKTNELDVIHGLFRTSGISNH